MKLFSLWQPWASFMDLGYKAIETRGWRTSYRGWMAIHAAKNKTAIPDADDILHDAGLLPIDQATVGGTTWPLGKILCVVRLVDCMPTETIRGSLTRTERAMGNYSDGRFAWVTDCRWKLPHPIEYRGTQGLRPITSAALREIREQGWSEPPKYEIA